MDARNDSNSGTLLAEKRWKNRAPYNRGNGLPLSRTASHHQRLFTQSYSLSVQGETCHGT